jgi:hypothetical protein
MASVGMRVHVSWLQATAQPWNANQFSGCSLRNASPPGTTSVTTVPAPGALVIVSLPSIRAARSRIPRNPKCPGLPCSKTAVSIPIPSQGHRLISIRQDSHDERLRAALVPQGVRPPHPHSQRPYVSPVAGRSLVRPCISRLAQARRELGLVVIAARSQPNRLQSLRVTAGRSPPAARIFSTSASKTTAGSSP